MVQPIPTYAVRLTPPGRAAVATVLMCGPAAAECVAAEFHAAGGRGLLDTPCDRIRFGRWGHSPGEEIVLARTAEDRVEIHCHGGQAAAHAIIDSLVHRGAAPLAWSDWISHEETDPIRAAARIALAEARTERTAAMLLDQFHGALRTAVERIIALLETGGFAEVRCDLRQLLTRAAAGLHLTRPFRVVLAGPPNVGKSSLINALLGYERAIVFDQPGTTRDVVTTLAVFDGWPVELSDTAGLRTSLDSLEAAGVARARGQLAIADQVILVFNGTQPRRANDDALRAAWPNALVVLSKADLCGDRSDQSGTWTSAITGEGVQQLQEQLIAKLVPVPLPAGCAVPFMIEHVARLQQAAHSVEQHNIAQAIGELRALLSALSRSNPRPSDTTAHY